MVSAAEAKPIATHPRFSSGLQQIAHDLSLSVSLVSKVLNGKLGTSRVSKNTMRVIHQRATQLGYTKNQAAAALVTRRQNSIGVFMHPLGVDGSGLPAAIVQAVAEKASEFGQRLQLKFFGDDENFEDQRRTIHPSIMDGAIVAGVIHRELAESLVSLERCGTPIVTVFDEPIDPAITNVGTDQVEVGRLATAHLIDQGCRRIAHISVMADRRRGYEAALLAASMPVLPELIYDRSPEFEFGVGVETVRYFLDKGIAFDGLVTQSDQQAAGALHTLLRAGKRVPQDVKVIGVDDSPPCQYSFVPLSSISQELSHCGAGAVALLMAKIGGQAVASIVNRPLLRARESSGAA